MRQTLSQGYLQIKFFEHYLFMTRGAVYIYIELFRRLLYFMECRDLQSSCSAENLDRFLGLSSSDKTLEDNAAEVC